MFFSHGARKRNHLINLVFRRKNENSGEWI
jgi:hypothetical protein